MIINLKSQIKKYLKDNRTNAYQLSLAAGVSPASITRFLRDERSIKYETAEKLLRTIKKPKKSS